MTYSKAIFVLREGLNVFFLVHINFLGSGGFCPQFDHWSCECQSAWLLACQFSRKLIVDQGKVTSRVDSVL